MAIWEVYKKEKEVEINSEKDLETYIILNDKLYGENNYIMQETNK